MEAMNDEIFAPIEAVFDEDDFVEAESEMSTQVATGNLGSLPETATESHIARFIFEREKGNLLWVASAGEQGELAVWTGRRWVEKDRGYRLLDGLISRWCDRLFLEMPAPPPNAKSDYRKKFMEARFQRGVRHLLITLLAQPGETCTSELEVFNSKPFLLGMKAKSGTYLVAELATGATREMRRDDFISKCIRVTADVNVATTRTDRFFDEITLGDAELKAFLLRLCALMLTGYPYQGIFFFWGHGRNGKGSLTRIMVHILGTQFVGILRGTELVVSKYDSDRAKRTYNKLEGARFATTSEAVGENLNLQMLKEMTGGDRLASARMRQDDRTFAPTHKLVLPTNERPVLPNDAAFQGRVYFVPFKADFTDRAKQDPDLEPTMQREAPGFLAKLIALCPEVVAHINALPAPRSVLDATTEMFEENDLAGQFKEDMLVATPGKHLSFEVAQQAAFDWLTDAPAVEEKSSSQKLSGVTVSVTQNYHERSKQVAQILAGLKARLIYKRLRPEGTRGRRAFHFLDVSLKESVSGD
jgi:P4 family phage/plasmid primase-like protien